MWPELQDDHLENSRKVPLDRHDIIIDKVAASYDNNHIVAVTSNNMVRTSLQEPVSHPSLRFASGGGRRRKLAEATEDAEPEISVQFRALMVSLSPHWHFASTRRVLLLKFLQNRQQMFQCVISLRFTWIH
jgi:hypothetical protein